MQFFSPFWEYNFLFCCVLFCSVPYAMITPGGTVYLQYHPALNMWHVLTKLRSWIYSGIKDGYDTYPTSAQGILHPFHSAASHPILSPAERFKTSAGLTELCSCWALATELTVKAGLCSQELSVWDRAMIQREVSQCHLSRRRQGSRELCFRK